MMIIQANGARVPIIHAQGWARSPLLKMVAVVRVLFHLGKEKGLSDNVYVPGHEAFEPIKVVIIMSH